MEQIIMVGNDWLSEGDKKSQARAEANRRKAALLAAKKLTEASDALNAFLQACRECSDASSDRRNGAADGRIILIGSMMEYAGYLDSCYSK